MTQSVKLENNEVVILSRKRDMMDKYLFSCICVASVICIIYNLTLDYEEWFASTVE